MLSAIRCSRVRSSHSHRKSAWSRRRRRKNNGDVLIQFAAELMTTGTELPLTHKGSVAATILLLWRQRTAGDSKAAGISDINEFHACPATLVTYCGISM